MLNDEGVLNAEPDSAIRRATLEIERHVAADGWDQQVRLFALVPTNELVRDEPELAESLGLRAADDGEFTPIEQDSLPPSGTLEQLLGSIEWPAEVAGCAIAVERVMLPPSAESDLPADPAEAQNFVAKHPDRADVRLVAAAARGGAAHATVRRRTDGGESELLEGPGLIPGLIEAIQATLSE